MGKTIELKSLHSPLKYYGIIVGGRNDYIHKVTGDSMFLAKCIFVDLNSEFIEHDFDELETLIQRPPINWTEPASSTSKNLFRR